MYAAFFKRFLDIIVSLAMLILLSPVLIILAVIVRIKLGSPVIFRQERPGRYGRIFGMYKFRSMTDERDANGELLPDEKRLTPFGRKLRSTSLDELPELFNVLKGDMSIVGPRPLLVRYLPLYNSRQSKRHMVRPGITGYAQAYGRNAISWEEKFEKDVWYTEHVSILTDLKILARTVKTVIVREGIDAAGGGIMPMFAGSSDEAFEKMGGVPRILFLGNDSTGLWFFRRQLMAAFMEKGYSVHAAFPDEKCGREIEESGVAVHHIPMNRRSVNPFGDLKYLSMLKKLYREIRPDLVLTYTIKPNVYGGYACRKMGIPYLSTVTGLGSAFKNKGLLRSLVTVMYREGLKGAQVVYFQNSENMRVFSECGITRDRSTALLPGSGVDPEAFAALPYPGHADDILRFLFVGRIMREKGVGEFIAAAGTLHDKYRDRVSFTVMGYTEGDMEEELRKAGDEGVIKIIGFQKDVARYFKEADAIVLPSYHEGMNNVLMEASASARACLASDIPGCREIVEDGVTGFLFEPKSADALTKAMEKFIALDAEERRSMGLAARDRMVSRFDRRIIIDRVLQDAAGIIYGKQESVG
ncbi:MAG: sugar transferase [Lachnospiraceae bacterium]|nr:sugar transferase [Lachnospiraceae bacterium]